MTLDDQLAISTTAIEPEKQEKFEKTSQNQFCKKYVKPYGCLNRSHAPQNPSRSRPIEKARMHNHLTLLVSPRMYEISYHFT
jgi:hypothetical protein